MTKEAFLTQIYQENAAFLLSICQRRVGYNRAYRDLAENCIQETFLTASESYDTIRNHPNIRGWLLQTCMNRLMASLRTMRYHQRLQAFSLDDPRAPEIVDQGGLESALHQTEAQRQLTRIQSALSEDELNIFTSYFVEHNTMHEVALTYAMGDEQVKNVIKRIRRKAM